MLVRDYMTSPTVTINPSTKVEEALQLMRQRKIRRLPVINNIGWLVGIVSERDLLHVSPSPATSLSIWELNYLVMKMHVSEIMSKKVTVVQPDTHLEEAAQIMLEQKIGGLPVVNSKNELVGIITETDIFRAFIESRSPRNGEPATSPTHPQAAAQPKERVL